MKTTARLRERVRWVAANHTEVLLATICFVFAAVGLAIALSASTNGDRPNALSGVATTLFFGLCGAGYFGLKYGDRLANASTHRRDRRRSHQGFGSGVGSWRPVLAAVVFAGWTVAAFLFGTVADPGAGRTLMFGAAVVSGLLALVGFATALVGFRDLLPTGGDEN